MLLRRRSRRRVQGGVCRHCIVAHVRHVEAHTNANSTNVYRDDYAQMFQTPITLSNRSGGEKPNRQPHWTDHGILALFTPSARRDCTQGRARPERRSDGVKAARGASTLRTCERRSAAQTPVCMQTAGSEKAKRARISIQFIQNWITRYGALQVSFSV